MKANVIIPPKKGFWQLADPKIWVASAIPMAVAFVYSINDMRPGSLIWFVIAVVSIFLIETGKNAVNEVVDYISGVDKDIAQDKKTPFSGGKKTIVEGKLTIRQAVMTALITYIPAVIIGLMIVFFREFNVLWPGMIGVGISVLYSLPPFKFAYRGLGEASVGFTFGPVIMTGMNILLTGGLDIRVAAASVPIGILIANVLWINQFPDYEVDKKGNKKNWVVRLGKEKSAYIHGFIYLAAYLSFIPIAIMYKSPVMLLPLLSVPLAYQGYKNAVSNHNDVPRLILSNMRMVQVYQLTGIMMIAAYIIYRSI